MSAAIKAAPLAEDWSRQFPQTFSGPAPATSVDFRYPECGQLEPEVERAVNAAGEVFDRKLVRFLISGRKGARIAARLAAIGILAGTVKPRDVSVLFDKDEVTPARLRLATRELQELFEADEKGGAE